MSPVLLGLVAALCWGFSDWLARGLARGMGSFRAQLWSQLVGLVALGGAVVASVVASRAFADGLAAASARAWGFAFLYAALIGGAALSFFEAFGKGTLAVVAPIVGGYGAVTVLWTLAFGARPGFWTLAGLGTVVAGAVLASIPQRGSPRSGQARGAAFAAVAAVLFGTAFFVLGREVAPQLGSLVPAFLSRLVGPVLLTAGAWMLGVSTARPPREHRFGAVASGLLASVATVATGLGSQGDDAAVVAVLGSLSVVVTVLIGLVVLREKLAPHQWAGVGLALVGIPLLA